MSPRRRTPAEALAVVSERTVVAANGCWLWQGTLGRDGYGKFAYEGRTRTAHRAVYELIRGAIPQGLDLDHVCHNEDATCVDGKTCPHRACVNPEHMEPVPRLENIARRKHRAATCRYGHPFSEANSYIAPDGYRKCRACGRERAAAYKARKRLRTAERAA